MEKQISQRLIRLLIFLVVISFTVIMFGCVEKRTVNYTPSNGEKSDLYSTFISSNESVIRFSFEYPSSYIVTDETHGTNNPELRLGLSNVNMTDIFHPSITYINILIRNYYPTQLGFPDSETEMNKHVSGIKWSLVRNYRLLALNNAAVDGVEGIETVITFREHPLSDVGHGTPRKPIFAVARDLFFDYKGMAWQISLYGDQDSYKDHSRVDFEHILTTFKFPK